RDDRRDYAGHAVRATALLPVRPTRRAQRREKDGCAARSLRQRRGRFATGTARAERQRLKMRTLVHCSVAALVLAGCTMGPDYVRPKFDTPTEFRFEPKAVAETADTAWWKRFGDPVLDTMIDEALANNVNLNIAVANVEQAAGVLTQTRSQLFPQIGYAATGEKVRTTEAGLSREAARLPNPQTAYQALLTASWEIDLWGRIRRQS